LSAQDEGVIAASVVIFVRMGGILCLDSYASLRLAAISAAEAQVRFNGPLCLLLPC
jgi:hypothetical protein